jgi:hypothetical protein
MQKESRIRRSVLLKIYEIIYVNYTSYTDIVIAVTIPTIVPKNDSNLIPSIPAVIIRTRAS